MSKKQWIFIVIGLIFLGLMSWWFLSSEKSKDESKDSIEEVKEEQQEKRKKVSKSVTEMLGLEEGERLLTKEEIKDFITKLKRDEGEEVVTDMHISDRLEEEYGFVNSVAYREGLMIEEDDSDFVKSQVIQQLADVLGNTDIYTEGSEPLVDISNPIEDEFDNEKYREPKEVVLKESFPLYRSDSRGFKEVDGIKIGYPIIGMVPYYYDIDDLEEIVETYEEGEFYTVNVEIPMLIEDTMSLKEVYSIYDDVEVKINDIKLDKIGTWFNKNEKEKAKKFIEDPGFLGLIHGLKEYEFSEDDLENKYVLKDSIITLGFEYNLNHLTDGENKFFKEGLFYMDFDYEDTPVINVNGEEFFTEIDPEAKLLYDEHMGKEVTEEMKEEAREFKMIYKK